MSKGIADGTVGPWAREKLEALGEYLNFYTTALKKQGHWVKSLTYVDAFAGSGMATLRRPTGEPQPAGLFDDAEAVSADPDFHEFVRGSPRVALDLPNRFSRYVFVERDPDRASELQRLRQEYGDDYKIEVFNGDAVDALDMLLAGDLGQPNHLAVTFLDPFGMQVPWSTIARLAATKQIEVVINFPLGMAIQRVLPRSGVVPSQWSASLDRLFGSHDWHEQVYQQRSDLFGFGIEKRKDAGLRLLEWYRCRLKEAFGFVSPPKLIRNTRGGHLYYLIWAGPNRLGLKGAHYILSKGDNVA